MKHNKCCISRDSIDRCELVKIHLQTALVTSLVKEFDDARWLVNLVNVVNFEFEFHTDHKKRNQTSVQ